MLRLPIVAFRVLVLLRVVSGTSNKEQISNSNCTGFKDRLVEPFLPFDQANATLFRYRKQQSVNLGSCFVHESWMTPSLFRGAVGRNVSEIDIASGWNSTDCARQVLENHWETYMNSSDFSHLSSIGINTVRLPIGYWSLGPEFCQDTPFCAYADVYRNSWAFVVATINMAAQAGLGVLVDLHGAVGSQNGQPHSGISDGQTGLFNNDTNVNKTLAVLTYLTQQLCNVSNIVGIQILNEPKNCDQLPGFYDKAIAAMRNVCGADFPLYIHDGFNLEQYSDYVAKREDFIVQDHHSYFVFTQEDQNKNASEHTRNINTEVRNSLAKASANQHGNLIIGEWSCALTPQSLSQVSNQMAARQSFGEAQLNTYSNTTAGWSFWAYKKEDCDAGWCFSTAVGNSLPSDFFAYISKCNSLPDFFRRDLDVRHCPEAIHQRLIRNTDSAEEQRSRDSGYSDGYSTAQFFCSRQSELAFIWEYMKKSIKQRVGPETIEPGTESNYREGFSQGLADAMKPRDGAS